MYHRVAATKEPPRSKSSQGATRTRNTAQDWKPLKRGAYDRGRETPRAGAGEAPWQGGGSPRAGAGEAPGQGGGSPRAAAKGVG